VQILLTSWEHGAGLRIVEFLNGTGFWWYLLTPFHYLGSEILITIILALVYWCISKRQGLRLMVLVLGSQILSNGLKTAMGRPRPFHVAPDSIIHIDETLQPGFPSGHTIFGTVTGLWFVENRRTTGAGIIGALFILFMGVSRMVHGMHYPQDVGAGWILGVLFYLLFIAFEGPVRRYLADPSRSVSIVPFTISAAVVLSVAALLGALLIRSDFESQKSILAPAGAVAGGIIGAVIEFRRLKMTVSGSLKQRVLRGVFGTLLLAALSVGLGAGFYALVGEYTGFPVLILYLFRYGLLGAAVTVGLPWLFVRLNLASSGSPVRNPEETQ